MKTIELIKTSHEKISSFSSIEIGSVAVLLIIHFSIKGNTKTVSMGKIAIVFDQAISSQNKTPIKSQINPWLLSKRLKLFLIALLSSGYIQFKNTSGDARYSLELKGEEFVGKILSNNLFDELTQSIKDKCQDIPETLVSNYRLLVG